jgi:hypothetical protein
MPKTKRDKAKTLTANAMAYIFYSQQMTKQLMAMFDGAHPELATALESAKDGQVFVFRLLYSFARQSWGEAAENWVNWATVGRGRPPLKGM